MSQRKPYLPPRVSRQEFGSDYLKWMAGLESGTQEALRNSRCLHNARWNLIIKRL
jgi:hypothetical protein